MAGLVLTYTFLLPYYLAMLAMIITNLNAFFTSLERVEEYEALPQEPPHEMARDNLLKLRPVLRPAHIHCHTSSQNMCR